MHVSGKRTLSKLNAFDFVVTVALGSTLATVLLSKDVALAEGVLAFSLLISLLISLQYVITWLPVRSSVFESFVKAEPTLLCHKGALLEGAMKAQRVSPDEILSAIRTSGSSPSDQVLAVVLETDGSLSVISAAELTQWPSQMQNVKIGDEIE